jgi:hypothetical protein
MVSPASAWYIEHLPHILPGLLVLGGVCWAAYIWVAEPPRGASERERWLGERAERRERRRFGRVDPGVARRGLLALLPLLAAAATGAVVYGLDLGGTEAPAGVIWVHAGIATLATLLAAVKVREVGWRRIRAGLRPGALAGTLASLGMAALLPPLLVTGIVELVAPSDGSFSHWAHLIASAWWTVLLTFHLARYLARAMRAVNEKNPVGAGGLAGGAHPGSTPQRPAPGLRPGRTAARSQASATGRRRSTPQTAR